MSEPKAVSTAGNTGSVSTVDAVDAPDVVGDVVVDLGAPDVVVDLDAVPRGQPDPPLEIVPLRRRHLRAVLRIEAQVYPRPWTLSLFLSELALRSTRAYFVALLGDEVVGYAGLMVTPDGGHVTTIAVDPAVQRRSIGTRLLLSLTREAVARGVDAMTLEVRLANHGAQALYRAFGYVPVGVRKNYYPETGEDALVMWAHDVHLPDYQARLAALEGARRW